MLSLGMTFHDVNRIWTVEEFLNFYLAHKIIFFKDRTPVSWHIKLFDLEVRLDLNSCPNSNTSKSLLKVILTNIGFYFYGDKLTYKN